MTKIFSISLLFIFSFLHASERDIVDSISENERLQKLNEFVIASELSNNLLDYENLSLFNSFSISVHFLLGSKPIIFSK